ncbi:MAG: DUF4931 domain-containing protein [Schwartzia sp.]|nr:DUF4931 domain-containing protein [Schwartzia sp. (in: firmicutes)]
MTINIARFNVTIGKNKPENIVHSENSCPFCSPETLTDIIESENGMIFLRNKYNMLEDADQFVLVEADRCGIDMPDYSKEHMHKLMRFGLKHWKRLEDSGLYDSVVFFKNHGRFSGGTMRHPHMQIVGFHHIDSTLMIEPESFNGIKITEKDGVLLNASTQPRLGFGEFNIIAQADPPDTFADFIQVTTGFITKRFIKSQESYNIFFYHLGDKLAAKLMPRFPTSPFYVGYDIRLMSTNFQEVCSALRREFE